MPLRIFRKVYDRLLRPPKPESIFMSENPRYRHYKIGRWTYGRPEIFSGEEAVLTIGSFCSFASGVKLVLGGEHRTDWISTYPFNVLFLEAVHHKGHPASRGAITIGHDVWIGQDASIFSGVNVGNGAVIAARTVVRRSVAPYSIVGGNPAKQLVYRFDQETIQALQEIAWWDWPLPKIKEAWPLLLAGDTGKFIAKYRRDSQQ